MEGLEERLSANTNRIRNQATLYFTYIFVVELVLKLIGLGPKAYVKDGMNILDGFISVTSVIELYYGSQSTGEEGTDLNLF